MRAEGTRAGGSQPGEVQCSPRAKTRVVVALLSPAKLPQPCSTSPVHCLPGAGIIKGNSTGTVIPLDN